MAEYIYPGIFREEANPPLLRDVWGTSLDIEVVQKPYGGNLQTIVNRRTYEQFVVDVGGGPLLSALGHMRAPNTGVMVIDPFMGVKVGGASFQGVAEAFFNGNYEEIPLHLRQVSGDYRAERLRLTDEEISALYESRASQMDETSSLFCVSEAIQSSVFKGSAFADLVTCYYPYPESQKASGMLGGCLELLKSGGNFQMVTEDKNYWATSTRAALLLGYEPETVIQPPRRDTKLKVALKVLTGQEVKYKPFDSNTEDLLSLYDKVMETKPQYHLLVQKV